MRSVRPKLDLNLVFVAEALYRHLSVSRAARELEVTQSAVSHALAKLRVQLDDPLFVRVAKGVAPTATAKSLRPAIEELAAKARALETHRAAFDPAKARTRFTIAATDFVEILLMPRLLPRLRREAPLVQVSLQPSGGELPSATLQSGAVDVACAGFYRDLPEGFFRTSLFDDEFAVGCRKNHPLARRPLTVRRFLEADHALLSLRGDLKPSDARGPAASRRIVYGSYSFTGMAWLLADTDLLLTAPRRLLERYRETFPVTVLEHPCPPPRLKLQMVWHAVTHADPAKAWLRRLVKESLAS